MICSGSRKGTVVAVTELQDKKEKRIIVPISIDVNGKNGIVNKIASVYGKNNIQNYLQNAIKNNQILAYNKEKAEALITVIGCQLSQATSAICFDNSIAFTTQNVKGFSEKIQREMVQEQPKTSAPMEKKSNSPEFRMTREQVKKETQRQQKQTNSAHILQPKKSDPDLE